MPRIYYDEDAGYLRCLEEERIELSGPLLEYYSLNRGGNVDIVYNEPDNDPVYGGSDSYGADQDSSHAWDYYPNIVSGDSLITMSAAIIYQEMDGREPSIREEGKKADFDAQIFIARNHWEAAIRGTDIEGLLPKESDVIYIWEEWWDVIKAGKGGQVLDSPVNVGYALNIKRRTEFTPDRKIRR